MKRNLRINAQLLVAIISLSLAGIIGLQAYLFRSAIIVRDAHFKAEAAQALHNVVKRIENLESQRFLSQTITTSPIVDKRNGFWVDSIIIFNRNTDSNRSVADTFIIGRNNQSLGAAPFTTDSNLIKAHANSFGTNMAGYQKYLEYKMRYMDTLMRQMLFQEMDDALPIEKRFSFTDFDSIIKQELAQSGLNLKYEFGVVENDRLTSLQTASYTVDVADFRVPLFRNDFFGGQKWLFITFPNRVSYLLNSMWYMLVLSGLFTALIIIAFGYTINQMQKQKKISQIKSDFISNMTHEFKTPIATINLAVDALSNPKVRNDAARVQHYQSVIREENKRMHAQVEKVLQLAMLDKQELQLNKESIDMHELIQSATNSLNMQLEKRGARLHLALQAANTIVFGDNVHLGNVLVNMIDNALKYGGDIPEIKIFTENENDRLKISVTDNGPGIAKDVQRRIFERFYRETQGNIHNVKGHGLGLSYVKEILEMHRGAISVQSNLGEGATFTIELPNTNT